MRSLEEVRAFERSGLEEGALSRCGPVEMSSLGVERWLQWHATCFPHPHHAARHPRSLVMRSLVTLLVAPFVVVAAVACVLLLEPVRWCVVRARPWRCRNAVVRHVAIGS
jgi:hypothetical protein